MNFKWFLFNDMLPFKDTPIIFFDSSNTMHSLVWNDECTYSYNTNDDFWDEKSNVYMKSYNMVAWMPVFALEKIIPKFNEIENSDTYLLRNKNNFSKDLELQDTITKYKNALKLYKEAVDADTINRIVKKADYYPLHGYTKDEPQSTGTLNYVLKQAANFFLESVINPNYGQELDQEYLKTLEDIKNYNANFELVREHFDANLLATTVPRFIEKIKTIAPISTEQTWIIKPYNISEQGRKYFEIRAEFNELVADNKRYKDKIEELMDVIEGFKACIKVANV